MGWFCPEHGGFKRLQFYEAWQCLVPREDSAPASEPSKEAASNWNRLKQFVRKTDTGWWFGCHFLFSHILGIIIPTDFHIFQRGFQPPTRISWPLWTTKGSGSRGWPGRWAWYGCDSGHQKHIWRGPNWGVLQSIQVTISVLKHRESHADLEYHQFRKPPYGRFLTTLLYEHGGFHKWRYPNSWLIYFMENPNLQWMMTGGTTILGNHHYGLTGAKRKECGNDPLHNYE